MNFKKVFLIALLILCIIGFAPTQVQAEAVIHSEEEKYQYIQDLGLTVKPYDPDKASQNYIVGFAVSDNENVAIGLSNNTVLICDKNAKAKMFFEFIPIEDYYYLHWNDDVLELIFYRSYRTYSIDEFGTVIDVHSKDPWAEATQELYFEIAYQDDIHINNNTYSVAKRLTRTKFLGGGTYDVLLRTEAQGEEVVLFQTIPNGLQPSTKVFLVFGGMFVVFVPLIIWRGLRLKRVKGKNTGDGSLS